MFNLCRLTWIPLKSKINFPSVVTYFLAVTVCVRILQTIRQLHHVNTWTLDAYIWLNKHYPVFIYHLSRHNWISYSYCIDWIYLCKQYKVNENACVLQYGYQIAKESFFLSFSYSYLILFLYWMFSIVDITKVTNSVCVSVLEVMSKSNWANSISFQDQRNFKTNSFLVCVCVWLRFLCVSNYASNF